MITQSKFTFLMHRHFLGPSLKGEKSHLESEIQLESSHPSSGMQNYEGSRCGATCWTLAHLIVTPAKSDGGQDHEQVLTTVQVEIRPQRIRLSQSSRSQTQW